MLNAAIPIVLVAGFPDRAATSPIGRGVASALLGLTPIAWFTFGFVSPSAVAIGGGLALWTGLLFYRPWATSLATTWLTVGGWAA